MWLEREVGWPRCGPRVLVTLVGIFRSGGDGGAVSGLLYPKNRDWRRFRGLDRAASAALNLGACVHGIILQPSVLCAVISISQLSSAQ